MEQDRDELHVVPAQHRVQHRVIEFAERRIGRHAAQVDIEAAVSELFGLALGGLALEIAAVGHAAGHRETPGFRRERELGRGEHVPDDMVALEIGVAPVALVVRQPELLD